MIAPLGRRAIVELALIVALVAVLLVGLYALTSSSAPTLTSTPSASSTGPAATAGRTTAPTAASPTVTATASPAPTSSPSPTASPAPTPTATVVGDVEIAAPPVGPTSCQADFEPIVATHPTDAERLAVAYERDVVVGGVCEALPTLAISHDGGRTWRIAPGIPWRGSGRFPDHHATIAWGPGPTPGSARLYWADATVDARGGTLASVAWSDDEGRTWSPLYVERRTPPWVGGFPDITVDRDPASPDYGVVYVAYNWLASAVDGPGLRVLASADFGRTWQAVEVPRAAAPGGYPAAWRIAYVLRTGPDGSLYVAFYQADLRTWDDTDIFSKGGLGNVGRLGFAVARLQFRRATRTFTRHPAVMAAVLPRNAWTAEGVPAAGTTANVFIDPMWQEGLDVDQVTGRVVLAVGDYAAAKAGAPRGSIRVGHSDDGGQTWSWTTVPALPDVDGRPESAFRPSVVAVAGRVVVTFQGIEDEPLGTAPALHLPTVETAYAISADDGSTFGPPQLISVARWNAAALETQISGPGLRERADSTASGAIVFVYGDGRLARPLPDARAGRSAVFAALIVLGPQGPGP